MNLPGAAHRGVRLSGRIQDSLQTEKDYYDNSQNTTEGLT